MKTTLIFLDTETTGIGQDDRLCQLAFISKVDGEIIETYNELFNPGRKIPPEASAVTHITNKMVDDKPAFKDCDDFLRIKDLLEQENSVMVAHNAKFDLGMLAHENIHSKNYICTLKVARYLDADGKIPRYNLQFLRYFLEMEIDAQAHDALGDIKVLCELFPRLYKSMAKELGIEVAEDDTCCDPKVLEKMFEISSKPSMVTTFMFGKHVGKKVADVAATDKGYLQWLLEQKKQNPDEEEDWIYTL
ncbi:MAG: exonuclease RNase and polymerase exodeoxyribonuclease, partial [Patescibacteria group bacterium]|nr:exonuclease RNase and polymerase exodeoxyribonuclease [Patescibacteria group bacterium]